MAVLRKYLKYEKLTECNYSNYLVILYDLICKGLRYKYISQIAYQNALLVFWKSPRMHQIVGTLFFRTLHEGLRT